MNRDRRHGEHETCLSLNLSHPSPINSSQRAICPKLSLLSYHSNVAQQIVSQGAVRVAGDEEEEVGGEGSDMECWPKLQSIQLFEPFFSTRRLRV